MGISSRELGRAVGEHPEVLLAEDLLRLARDHEHRLQVAYRWRALRLLTFHAGLSRLMQALGEESRQRLLALNEVLTGRAPEAWAMPGGSPPPGAEGLGHFFILDETTARQALRCSLLEEGRTRRFYDRVRRGSAASGLDLLLDTFIEQARAHCRLLEETRQGLNALHRPLGSVAPHRRRRNPDA
ncbi:hypothetical protein ACFPTY_07525 [Halomonas beimenensis]|uniref:Ferritin/DPS protein domain-containing protein n=1 Tax=Halomonas beimenensis TaxID=475662 RepID=A0A291P7E1_9GAMM|nr:hypothetical protein [Halomonas beimenensis]ATJ82833.1 hypothetical protein BEI_1846 [Halomonas beimenensis]